MNSNLSLENPDNFTQDRVNTMSEDEKTSYMLKYVKTLRINSNIDVFERLLNCGFSPNVTSPEGKSLLMIAAEKGLLEHVNVLLDAGADVEKQDNYGKTALFYAIEAATENTDVISVLLDYKANPNTETNEGKTPLIRAVEKNQYGIAKALLKKNADVNFTNYDTGDSALHLAVRQENANMVQMLLENKADLNKKNRKKLTPVDLAQGNSSIIEVIQAYLPKQKNLEANQNIINAQINEFMQIHSQRRQSPDPNQQEQGGKQNEEMMQTQDFQGQVQGQDQGIDASKQKQPLQDYRRHQQQQQLNQKKSPQHFQQKVEKEPPARKYPGKTDPSGLRRTVSSNETYPKDGMLSDRNNSNKTNENIAGTPGSITSTTTTASASTNMNNMSATYSTNTLEVPQNPMNMSQSYTMGSTQNEDLSSQSIQGYNTRAHDHGKSPENNQYMYQNRHPQAKKANTIGPSSTSEVNSISGDRFPEQRDMVPSIMKSPSGDYVNQFHNQQQQQQMQAAFIGNAAPMNQMGFNGPPPQMKGNVSPNFYGNQQYFAASPNPNNAQPYQKKKPKGQINTQNTNKNFPMNAPNAANPVQGQNMPQNMPQGQYNRGNMEGRPDQVFPPRGAGPNSQANPKFNKGGDRNFQDGNMQQRGFMSPQGYPNMPIPQNVQDMPEVPKMASETMVKMPGNREEGNKDQKGGRPQQQQYHHQQQQQQPQGNIMFNNNGGMFTPNFIMDMRVMQNNMPGQNPVMFNAPYPQGQPGNINMMNNVGQNMPQNMAQNNFMGYNQNMASQRNPTMMGKGQMMQASFNYPNGVQMGGSMDPKVVHLNMNDPITAENMKLTANVQSIYKGITDQMQDIEKMKVENKELKMNLDDIQQNEKTLQDKLREKERLIEELKKKNEELELKAKEYSSKHNFLNSQDSNVMTDGLLDNFQACPLDKILQEPKPNVEFWKHDQLSMALHEEVAAFEKSVDNFNMEKKNMFESLVTMIRQTVAEVVTETEFYIYGSFATGLSLPWSDIDIVVKIPQLYYNGYAALLDSIESNLKKKKWVDDIKVIKNTSVPVLKITCSKSMYTSKKVDISLQDTRHNGLACVDLVKDYLTLYPALRPLVLVLKQFLYRLNLNDTYSGGLSSYGLILMVVYLFQTRELQHSMTPVENQNLGSLLLSFLFFYGFEFDYYNQFLVNPKKIPKGNEINDPYAENMNLMALVNQNPPTIMEPKIIIQDPLSGVNNVGRSTFQIKQIKNAFMAAYFEAFKPCICEVHKFVGEIDTIDGKKPVHKCANIIRRMLLAVQPLK